MPIISVHEETRLGLPQWQGSICSKDLVSPMWGHPQHHLSVLWPDSSQHQVSLGSLAKKPAQPMSVPTLPLSSRFATWTAELLSIQHSYQYISPSPLFLSLWNREISQCAAHCAVLSQKVWVAKLPKFAYGPTHWLSLDLKIKFIHK